MNATVVDSCPVEVQQLRFRNVGHVPLLADGAAGNDSPASGCQTLAVSSRYDVLAAVCGNWLVLASASQPASTNCRRVRLPHPASHVAISCDDTTLLVVCPPEGGGYLYDVRLLASCVSSSSGDAGQFPSPCCSVELFRALSATSSQDRVLQIEWSPAAADCLAVVLASGGVAVFRLQVTAGQCGVTRVGWLPGDTALACSLAWSRKGKQLVVGRRDGALVQYKPDLSEARRIAAPPLPPTNTTPARCVSIVWLSTYEFVCGYRSAAAGAELMLVHVTAPKQGAVRCVNYGDPCFSSTGGDVGDVFHLLPLLDWQMLLVASRWSMELAVIGSSDDLQPGDWQPLVLDDDARAELPLADGCEQFPAAAAVALCSTRPVDWLEGRQLPPAPLVHVLTAGSAVLHTFALINVRSDAKQLTSPAERLSADDLSSARARGCVNIVGVGDSRAGQLSLAPAAGAQTVPVSASSGAFSGAAATALSILSSAAKSSSSSSTVSHTGFAPASSAIAVSACAPSTILSKPSVSLPPTEPVSGKLPTEPVTRQVSPAALSSAIAEEVASLQSEVRSVCDGSGESGPVATAMRALSLTSCQLSADAESLAGLGQFMVDLRTTLTELSTEIDALNADALQSVGSCEEVRSLQLRASDTRLQHLLRLRPPPAAQLQRLAELRRLQTYLHSQLVAANRALDDQWSLMESSSGHQASPKLTAGSSSDTASTVYTVLASHRAAIGRLRVALDSVMSALPPCSRSTAAGSAGVRWSERQIDLVTEQMAATGLAASSHQPVSDVRRCKLQRSLAARGVVAVRRAPDHPPAAAVVVADSTIQAVSDRTVVSSSGDTGGRAPALPRDMTSTPLSKPLSTKTALGCLNVGDIAERMGGFGVVKPTSALSDANVPASIVSQSFAASTVSTAKISAQPIASTAAFNYSVNSAGLGHSSQNRGRLNSMTSATSGYLKGSNQSSTLSSSIPAAPPQFLATSSVKTPSVQSGVLSNVTTSETTQLPALSQGVTSPLFGFTAASSPGSHASQPHSSPFTSALAKSTGGFTFTPSTKIVSFSGIVSTGSLATTGGDKSLGDVVSGPPSTVTVTSAVFNAGRQASSAGLFCSPKGVLATSTQSGGPLSATTTSPISFLSAAPTTSSGIIFGLNTVASSTGVKQPVSNISSMAALSKAATAASSASFLHSAPSGDGITTVFASPSVASTTKTTSGSSLFSSPVATAVPGAVSSSSIASSLTSNPVSTATVSSTGGIFTFNKATTAASLLGGPSVTAASKNIFGATVSSATVDASGSTSTKFGTIVAVSPGVSGISTPSGVFGGTSSSSNVTTASSISFSGSVSTVPSGLFGPNPSTGNVFGGAVTTTSSGLFGAKSVSGSVFGGAVSSASGGLFGTTSSAPGTVFGGTSSSTSVGSLGTTSSASGTVFGGISSSTSLGSFGTTSLASGTVFGGTSSSTSLGSFGTTSSASGSVFGVTKSSTSGSLFGTSTATTGSVFGGTASTTSGLFGTVPSSSNAFGATVSSAPGSVFSAAGSVFGAVPSTSGSVFGSPSSSGSVFGSVTSSKANGAFGNTSQNSAGIFGAVVSSAPSGVFGMAAPASSSVFGAAVSSSASVFGGTTAPKTATVFGASASPASSGVFGGASAAPSNLFGSSAGLGGLALGGSASSERAGTNVFGGGGSVFGQSPSSLFSAQPGVPATSPAASPGKSSAFGAPPSFGSPSAAFGTAPAFGATSPAFGGASSPSANGAFGASQALPSFGSLAVQGSSPSSFGTLSPGSGQFGAVPAQGSQQQFSGSSFTAWR